MVEIVERLKAEKNEGKTDFEELGREEAMEYVKEAHYEDIKEALKWDSSSGRFPKIEDFQEYVHNVIADEHHLELGLNDRDVHYWPYNDKNEKFWEGWKNGIEELWEQAKNEIEL